METNRIHPRTRLAAGPSRRHLAGWMTATLLLAMMLMYPPALLAQDSGRSTEAVAGDRGIAQTIEMQIAAFKRDDAAAAFAIAAPVIQNSFGTPEAFMTMVARSYQPVFRAQKLIFLSARADGANHLQPVLIQGPDGALTKAVYTLIRLDGKWRITGCVLLRDEGSPT